MVEIGSPGGMLEPGWKLRRVKGIAWRMIEDEAVLVNVRSDEVLHLNPTASYLWSRLDGERSLEEIAEAMTLEFEVEKEEALRDVMDFASRLLEKGVAEVV
ncbi:PqqD family protein [Candidatus Solincola tengchongensis]|uniref:PqqD family protein n=1 Tax=Candidatus Solincola tengchongensis TaxID=2900693 RepID=UPI00257B9DEB|nr:PqqD family protein [Candidatus Solincola tengchongensis]